MEAGILVQIENDNQSRSRNRTFVYEEYLNILKTGTERFRNNRSTDEAIK